MHVLSEENSDDSKDGFYEEMSSFSNNFLGTIWKFC
jgi:hypothetical protein